MDQFEFQMVVWPPNEDGGATVRALNALGAEGWSAVGMAPRTSSVPVPGRGGSAIPEMVILLQRRRS